MAFAIFVLFLSLLNVVGAVAPGSYFVTNAAFPDCALVGTDSTNEGVPLATFCFTAGVPSESNTIWTVDSTESTLKCELLGIFAATDASNTASGGMTGAGVFSVAALNPQPPLLNIGSQAWEFVQGASGTFIVLAGSDQVWTVATNTLFTQIHLEPLDSTNTRQQWIFTPHALA